MRKCVKCEVKSVGWSGGGMRKRMMSRSSSSPHRLWRLPPTNQPTDRPTDQPTDQPPTTAGARISRKHDYIPPLADALSGGWELPPDVQHEMEVGRGARME